MSAATPADQLNVSVILGGLDHEGEIPWTWLLELIKENEAAQLAGELPQSWRKRRCEGGGPAHIRLTNSSRGKIRYRRLDVLRWIAERRHASTSAETWSEPAVGALTRDGQNDA